MAFYLSELILIMKNELSLEPRIFTELTVFGVLLLIIEFN